MKIKEMLFNIAGIVAGISLFIAAPSYGANIVVGGDSATIGKIIVVSPQSTDTPSINGVSLINALNSIADASETNPYLLKLGPGIYDIQINSIQMKPFVDLEGSGEKVTTITGAITSGSAVPSAGTVIGSDHAELRFLTVENTGTGIENIAILNLSSSPSISHVTANSIGTGGLSCYNYAVYNYTSSPKMTNITATASGTFKIHTIHNESSSPTMANIEAIAKGVQGSDNWAVYNNISSPVMSNVTASAIGSGGGGYNYGIYNANSSPSMMNIVATASGAGTYSNTGIYNDFSSPRMLNIVATASGASINSGIHNSWSSPTITNVTATGSGGVGTGIFNLDSGTIKINHSVIMGTTNTINNGSGVTTFVGNSQLDGGIVDNAGALTCVGSYNAT